jgi:hypothetical protein
MTVAYRHINVTREKDVFAVRLRHRHMTETDVLELADDQARPAKPTGRGLASALTPAQPVSETPRPAAPAGAPPLPADTQSDKAIHDWLTTRIMALRTKRQSRWQRILDFLARRPKQESASQARPKP